MRIVIISTMSGFSWGGSEELWWQTALYAHQQGHDVRIVVFEKKNVPQKLIHLQNLGVSINYIGNHEIILLPFWKRAMGKIFRGTSTSGYKNRFSFIHALKVDFLLLNQGGTTDITYIPDLKNFFDNLQSPYSVLNHHHKEYVLPSYQQQNILLDLYKGASNLFFVAHRNIEVLERQLAASLSTAEIVKNPVNIPQENILPWPGQTLPRFAVVARLDVDYKGQDILLQTLAADKWKERIFEVDFFGHGPHEAYLSKLILFYGLEKKVFLKGQSENILNIWQHHHALILPSRSEGTPLSLVEALLCGRPCLVTDVGDSAALITDNETGWIANTASVKALDEALERAWLQRTDWQKMGILAHSVTKKFIDPDPGKTLFEKLMHE